MKNTTVEEYYVVKSRVGDTDEWFEDKEHYAFIEDVEASCWNTKSDSVKVFRRKVTVVEEEVE